MAIRTTRIRGLMHHKLLLGVLLSALGLGVLCVVQPYVGPKDAEFGYYGPYNRVKHVLESMPGVDIAAHYRHEDTVLESFGFTLLMDGKRTVQVNVSDISAEHRTWRKSRLRELLQKQIDANQPPQEYQMGLFPDLYYEKSPELKAWRRTRPDPVSAKPMDPKQVMQTTRKLRPGESVPKSIDPNQPLGASTQDQP